MNNIVTFAQATLTWAWALMRLTFWAGALAALLWSIDSITERLFPEANKRFWEELSSLCK